ncbi:MAG: LysM repeat protein, partial [Flavobacteriales bacterium]
MKINKFVIFVFVFITTVLAEKSMAQIFGNRTKYKTHEVKQKETVYGISKMYDLTIDELYKHNPEAKKGLLIGGSLLIPEKKWSRHTQDENEIGEYTIQPMETFYSLSKKFEMPISKLIELNPALRMGPKVGQVIKVKANLIIEDTTGVPIDSIKISLNTDSVDLMDVQIPRIVKTLKPKYKVAILLPLFLEENDTVMVYNDSPEKLIYQKSEIGVEVLMGIECAIDSLKKLGLTLDVYLLDTKNKPERCVQLARSPLIKSMDLIIGPLFSKNLKPVAGLLNRDSVQVLNLFSKNLDLVNTYTNVWQCTPSEREETAALVNYINANCPKKNVVLIRQDDPSQKLWADYARKYLMQRDSLDTLSI